MTEKEQAQFEIMQIRNEITLLRAELYIKCEAYQEKWHDDLSLPKEKETIARMFYADMEQRHQFIKTRRF